MLWSCRVAPLVSSFVPHHVAANESMSGRISPEYVFVGAFRPHPGRDGSVGGQLYACRTLLASPLIERVSFRTIDSTTVTVPPPALWRRVTPAIGRMRRFASEIRLSDVDGAFIFSSAGMSILEKGSMALVASALGKRVVFCPRSGLILDQVQKSAAMREAVRRIIRACDVVVCQSSAWKDFYRELSGRSEEHFVIIHNWLDASHYLDSTQARRERQGPTTFLYLGWLEPYKGILDYIEAIAERKGDLNRYRFIVCGSGNLAQRARQLAVERGVGGLVDFRGWVTGDDKHAVLAEADVLVVPSHREGMPNALLEGMATGLATIATRAGGIPDVIVDDSVGVLLDPQQPSQLAAAMVDLGRDRSRRLALGEAALRQVLAHHDIGVQWPKVCRALVPE